METINLISGTEILTTNQLSEWLEAQKINFINFSFQEMEPRVREYYKSSFSIDLEEEEDSSRKKFFKELNNFLSRFFSHRYQLKNLDIYYSDSSQLILYNYEHYSQIILL